MEERVISGLFGEHDFAEFSQQLWEKNFLGEAEMGISAGTTEDS